MEFKACNKEAILYTRDAMVVIPMMAEGRFHSFTDSVAKNLRQDIN